MEIIQKHTEMAKTNIFKHSIDKNRELKDYKGEWVGENIYHLYTEDGRPY